MSEKKRAPRNRTITLTASERDQYRKRLRRGLSSPVSLSEIIDSTICQDLFQALEFLPSSRFDLIFADPPYNLSKSFDGKPFRKMDPERYEEWLGSWVPALRRLLKPRGSLYICGDWRSSAALQRTLSRHFIVQNRITFEREKGRGSKRNWKNASEDIWFATVSGDYTFNVESVMLKRRVLAPYTDEKGGPKDWAKEGRGRYRLTHPSNLWTDLTIPFWSMPENTDHPTQKPEKLLAKIILAGSNPGEVVLDPFLGSGTTSVVARKLGRHYVGVEINQEYCCLAEKRLALAERHRGIQGFAEGVFWERNTLADRAGPGMGGRR